MPEHWTWHDPQLQCLPTNRPTRAALMPRLYVIIEGRVTVPRQVIALNVVEQLVQPRLADTRTATPDFCRRLHSRRC